LTDIQALRSQEYSTNLELLSQQMTPKLAPYAIQQTASGNKAFRMMSQIDSTSATERSTSAKPAQNQDVPHDGRWVYPRMFDWGKVIDDIDLLQTNISPQGAYTRSAVAALNRTEDDLFTEAFFGVAQTGETGSTNTQFSSGNQIAASEGGSGATGLNIEKLRLVQKGLLDNNVDIDMEQIYIGVSPKQHDDLLALTQVVSTDFNERPVLVDGMVRKFLNMNFIISTRLPTDSNDYRRLPVWVPSGMGCGVWKEISGVLRTRPDLQGDPDYAEASMMKGFTRLEEAKCFEIKCSEA
jgi:hypothetical protein